MYRNLAAFTLVIFSLFPFTPRVTAGEGKTSLLPDSVVDAITAQASGTTAKATVVTLASHHRVQATAGFHDAAAFVAARAREYGLEDVHIESFPADGATMYNSFRAYFGWEAESAEISEVSPRAQKIAAYPELRVALADYSNDADVTAPLVDVGRGTSDAEYAGKDVKGAIVLASGDVTAVHSQAVEKRGAAGVLSYQPNQSTGWSGDYKDIVRWGHLSPYNLKNTFAFMISLGKAREFAARLATGEAIRLHAVVRARMKPSAFEVVSAIIPGTDPNAGEIVYSCHLCHQSPGANDNASGAATILEDARILSTLIKTGAVPRPRRTIRFLWPPEISGTACYLARHPEIVARMRAAIHMDMVGGDFAKTKAVFHLTHTPASLPSAVNDVSQVFGDYVINGSLRAAATGDAANALYSADGSKELLVADHAPFSMGSDHDVYQEGSFRVPTIYLNDWPDVFIHTNGDVPENIDSTKLRRVAAIGAMAGYFLASAGPDDARRLAVEVFARGAERQGAALRRAIAFGNSGSVTVQRFEDARAIVNEAGRQERESLASVKQFAEGDSGVASFVDHLIGRVVERTSADVQLIQGMVPIPADVVPVDEAAGLVPVRNAKVVGPMSVYFFDYMADKLGAPVDGNEMVQYETLNLVNGRRSVRDIQVVLNAAYGSVGTDEVLGYIRALEKAGVVTIRSSE